MQSTSLAADHRSAHPMSHNPNAEIFRYIQGRQLKTYHRSPLADLNGFLSIQLPGLLREHEYPLGKINKIFAAKWLSDRQVAIGSKCNKVCIWRVYKFLM